MAINFSTLELFPFYSSSIGSGDIWAMATFRRTPQGNVGYTKTGYLGKPHTPIRACKLKPSTSLFSLSGGSSPTVPKAGPDQESYQGLRLLLWSLGFHLTNRGVDRPVHLTEYCPGMADPTAWSLPGGWDIGREPANGLGHFGQS